MVAFIFSTFVTNLGGLIGPQMASLMEFSLTIDTLSEQHSRHSRAAQLSRLFISMLSARCSRVAMQCWNRVMHSAAVYAWHSRCSPTLRHHEGAKLGNHCCSSLRTQKLTGCGSLSGALASSAESGRPRSQAWDSYLQVAPPSMSLPPVVSCPAAGHHSLTVQESLGAVRNQRLHAVLKQGPAAPEATTDP